MSRKNGLPVIFIIADYTVLDGLAHLIQYSIAVGMGHHQGLRAGTLLRILLNKRIVTGYLPLLVVEVWVGLIVGLALSVGIRLILVIECHSEPSATDIVEYRRIKE